MERGFSVFSVRVVLLIGCITTIGFQNPWLPILSAPMTRMIQMNLRAPFGMGSQSSTSSAHGSGARMARFTSNALSFAKSFQNLSGLNYGVILGWIAAETSGYNTTNGPNNWLNVGSFDDGFTGGGNNVWNSPGTAAEATYSWMTGRTVNGVDYTTGGQYGTGVGSEILATKGQSATSQVDAIQSSNWASSHYGYNLMSDVAPYLGGKAPKPTVGNGPNGGIVRPGGTSSGGNSAAAGSLLDSYQSSLEQPTQSGTDYVSLSSTLFGWVPGYSQVSSAVTDVGSFLSFIAWIFSPITLLRAVEFLTGIAIMGFGIETAFKSVPSQQRRGLGGAVNAVGNLPQTAKRSKLVRFAMEEPVK